MSPENQLGEVGRIVFDLPIEFRVVSKEEVGEGGREGGG